MKKLIIAALILLILVTAGILIKKFTIPIRRSDAPNNTGDFDADKLLDVYSIENLSKTSILPGTLTVKQLLQNTDDYNSYSFSFSFRPDPSKNEVKTTTGLINIPNNSVNSAVIVLLRGYVDQKTYVTGAGTKRVGEYFAGKGYITIAPDFLGYGNSDKEAQNIFESRFQTYTTILSLLKTLENNSTDKSNIVGNDKLSNYPFSRSPILLWGHSNGGQIALTILEITGKNYPTALWAPVSKPFPYSILYYTDQSDDKGKLIRKELAVFESTYDVEKYNLVNYFDKIQAPVLLQQGTADDAVPLVWSNSLYANLSKTNSEIMYKTYPKADHNMNPLWTSAIEDSGDFFLKYIDK